MNDESTAAVGKSMEYLIQSCSLDKVLLNDSYYVFICSPSFTVVNNMYSCPYSAGEFIRLTDRIDKYISQIKKTYGFGKDIISDAEFIAIKNAVAMLSCEELICREVKELEDWLLKCYQNGLLGIEPTNIGNRGIIWVMGIDEG